MSVNVRAVYLAGMTALLLHGCGKQEQSVEPAGDIRGAPIAAKPAAPSTNVAAAVTTPPAATNAATSAVPAVAAGNGYAAVGFEQLSGYQIEVSDELLG